jgi:broad specificity phosphatase PhoE
VLQYSQNTSITTVYLVRHAEKELNTGKNPDLTQIGKERAEQLAFMLKEVELNSIFSTEYKRTINTVKPISKLKQLKVKTYHPFKSASLINEIMNKSKGKSVLIVGHSNTLAKTISDFGARKIDDLNEKEYSKIFILTLMHSNNKTTTKLEILNY